MNTSSFFPYVASLLQILVLNTNTQELVASFRVTTGTSNTTAIKSIEFARKGRWESRGNLPLRCQPVSSLHLWLWWKPSWCFVPYSCFLINTADRIIRVYDGREILTCGRDGEPEPMQKLQDLVNRSDIWCPKATMTQSLDTLAFAVSAQVFCCSLPAMSSLLLRWLHFQMPCVVWANDSLLGLLGSAVAFPVMVNTLWPARPGSMPSISGKRALETWWRSCMEPEGSSCWMLL